jgi:hypothetical protein
MASNQCNRVIVCRDQEPSLEIVSGTKVSKEIYSAGVVALWPGDPITYVPGGRGHQVPTLFDHPNRDSATTQTSCHAKCPIVSSHQERASGCATLRTRRCWSVSIAGCDRCRHMSQRTVFTALPRIPRVTALEVKSAPATNRISGPKLQAAGAPTK